MIILTIINTIDIIFIITVAEGPVLARADGTPYCADHILVYDPATAVARKGNIYGIPYCADRIWVYDPATSFMRQAVLPELSFFVYTLYLYINKRIQNDVQLIARTYLRICCKARV